ncbi:hypothetical protein OAP59_01835 [Flavobacteriales bacterium]|nr:hypothetical protein [Flavobacteriales bacterium]
MQRNFVERGDSALAWSFVAWGIVLVPVAQPMEGIQTWTSLLMLCGALDQTLRMHRQPSTSNLQFRAGLLAGLAVSIQPLNAGILLGLIAVQIRTRPAIFREWVMLTFGIAHGLLIAEFCWTLPFFRGFAGNASAEILENVQYTRQSWRAVSMITAGIFGLFMLIRENPRLVLKTKNTRYNAIFLLLALAGTASLLFGTGTPAIRGLGPASQWTAHWGSVSALALGFLTVSLVPKRERKGDKLSALDGLGWVIFVGTLLVVFGLNYAQ